MTDLKRLRTALVGAGAGLGITALGLMSAAPAFAQVSPLSSPAACAAAGNEVRITATDAALSPTGPGGTAPFTGNAVVTVECFTAGGANLGSIANAQLTLTAAAAAGFPATYTLQSAECVAGTTPPATSPAAGTAGNPIACNLGADGTLTFNVTSNNLNTTGTIGIQVVGTYGVGDGNLQGRTDTRLITAPGVANPGATPELSSIALFGTGALGMGGYAAMRVRTARRRRDEA